MPTIKNVAVKKSLFLEKHKKLSRTILTRKPIRGIKIHETLLAKLLVSFARIEIGYSEKTEDLEIFRSLKKAYERECT